MAATERKIPGTFAPVPGGYSQQISANTALFIPDFSVSRYDPSTGEVYGYAPDYDALEAAKTPAVQATVPGEYSYCYEMQQAPHGLRLRRRSCLLWQAQHGDIAWYDGVTDLHYENGKYYKLIPPPPEVTLIDLTEYTGPLDENGLPPSLTGNPPANHETGPDDHK